MGPSYRPPAPMPLDIEVALPRDLTVSQAQALLQQAQQQYFKLLTGQLPTGVETPQLGKVTFAATTAADMQRLIDYLNGVVAAGGTAGMTRRMVRRPFSFFAWP